MIRAARKLHKNANRLYAVLFVLITALGATYEAKTGLEAERYLTGVTHQLVYADEYVAHHDLEASSYRDVNLSRN